MTRAFFGALAGIVVWASLWMLANGVLANVFPDEARVFREGGSLTHVRYLGAALAFSAPCSLIAGTVTEGIAKERARSAAVIATLVLVTWMIFTQAQFWERMPAWYHVSLIVLLAALMPRSSWPVNGSPSNPGSD
tara:strand:+ start:10860 stop:11264 length:405 start_codon:yes stop_codon:yes gene_type:complete